MEPLGYKELPKPLSFRSIFGPSFIFLGLGLGSGELILWPYLVSNFGLGIIWAAVLGVTFQFFLNMEIERYALVTGESVFVGLARKIGKIVPIWFLLSTFIPWVWPGIIASSGGLFGALFGVPDTKYLTIGLLLVIGLILTLGPVLYKTVEGFQKILIAVGTPIILGLTVYLAKGADWAALGAGIVGIGNGYQFLPQDIPMAIFLAAFAYAGAGGNLNLAQAFYIKEKGYGMGRYGGRITSLLTGKKEEISLEGNTFVVDSASLPVFGRWWKLVNLEHFLVFFIMGTGTILLLALLAFITVYGKGSFTGINFVIFEASAIGIVTGVWMGKVFLFLVATMLFATQLTVLDATSRIMAENLAILFRKRFPVSNLSIYFYSVLWLQILAGVVILLIGGASPLTLLTISAVLNAGAMMVATGLTTWLNLSTLHVHLRPKLIRALILVIAFFFFLAFTAFVVKDNLFK